MKTLDIHPKAKRHNILQQYSISARMVFMLFAVVIYYYALFSPHEPSGLLLWVVSFAVYILASGFFMMKYEPTIEEKTTKTIEYGLILHHLILGLFISAASWMLFGISPDLNMSLSIIVTAVSVTTIVLVSFSMASFAVVNTTQLVAMGTVIILYGDNLPQASLHLAGIPITIFLAYKVNQFYLRTASMQFHNEELMLEANQAKKDKNKYLEAINHDLRQPVAAAKLHLDYILSELKQGSLEQAEERLGKVKQCNETLSQLLDSLVDMSYLDSIDEMIFKQYIHLPQLFKTIEDEYKHQFQAQGRELRVFNANIHIESDLLMLQRILKNLVSNALKYADGDVLIGAMKRGDSALILVCDQGEGIPEHKLNDIFLEHVQLNGSSLNHEDGSGLGLAIVKQLVEKLGHEIEVRSRLGHGTTFSIRVKLKEDNSF